MGLMSHYPAHGYLLFDTAIGHCGLAWGERGISGVLLPEGSEEETRRRMQRLHPALAETCEADAAPQPSLGSARELFKVMRDAGLDVEFQETGERIDLKQGAELAIFRILQEALSNALSHGGEGTKAKVTFKWTDDGLQVLVDDDGIRAEAVRNGLDPDLEAQQHRYTQEDDLAALTRVPTGRGMTEMRERTELFGGVFNAYTVPGVGFSISAIFPALRYHNGVHGVKLEAR